MGDTLHQDLITCFSNVLHNIILLYITPHIDICIFVIIIFISAINQLLRFVINKKYMLPGYRLK